ncbi:conserved hypothetical protein [Listeria monocytogenes str. 4b H7858]|nr:conserved hypothetical protein [Listeria monocytogenes str. 4b H7858] [Listeria monocytogenes serotype 4b str. H7858]
MTGKFGIAFPKTSVVPFVAFSIPMMVFTSVVFPAPDGPIKPNISPFSISRVILVKICFFPIFTSKLETLIAISDIAFPPFFK